jgi:hypothetical protein
VIKNGDPFATLQMSGRHPIVEFTDTGCYWPDLLPGRSPGAFHPLSAGTGIGGTEWEYGGAVEPDLFQFRSELLSAGGGMRLDLYHDPAVRPVTGRVAASSSVKFSGARKGQIRNDRTCYDNIIQVTA